MLWIWDLCIWSYQFNHLGRKAPKIQKVNLPGIAFQGTWKIICDVQYAGDDVTFFFQAEKKRNEKDKRQKVPRQFLIDFFSTNKT